MTRGATIAMLSTHSYADGNRIREGRKRKDFYNRRKGEVETTVRALGSRSLTILRPSLLVGERTEFRPVEVVLGKLSSLVPGRGKPVNVRQVARAMVHAGQVDAPGHVMENTELRAYSP